MYNGENSVEKVGGGSFANFRYICFDFVYYFILILYLSNCLIRCVCKKSFLSFSYFSMVIQKICKIKTNLSEIRKALPLPPTSSTEFPPLYMCCNIHHFGITKRKVMASKLQVMRSKLTSLTAID